MVWTTPQTWTAALVTVAEFNEQIRDNLDALKDPPSDKYLVNEGSDYSTSSTSYVNVDATDLALTITTFGGDIVVHFHGTVNNSGAGSYFDVDVDGVRYGGDDGIIRVIGGIGSQTSATSFTILIEGLSAASHTFTLQWRVVGGTATMYAGAGTSGLDLHPEMWVREVS